METFNRRINETRHDELAAKRDAWVAAYAAETGGGAEERPRSMHEAAQKRDQPFEIFRQADDWIWEWAERRDELKAAYGDARAGGASKEELATILAALQQHMALDSLEKSGP